MTQKSGKKPLNVVTVGGGMGSFTLLSGLKHIKNINITAIVAMTDNGGSTGMLRDELGVLPPGDARQCLIALSEESDMVRKLMSYRFEDGGLAGHNFGNIFLAGLEKVTGNFIEGIEVASKILKVKGKVVPVTDSHATLHAILSNGKVLKGEDTINQAHLSEQTIQKLYIEEDVYINQSAASTLLDADYVIICPGVHYCSVLPNLVVPGFKTALKKSNAKIIYVPNLTNKKGHTLGWTVQNYLDDIERHLGRKVDHIVVNNELPSEEQITAYTLEEGDGVLVRNDISKDPRAAERPLISYAIIKSHANDSVAHTRSFIRHDPLKIKRAIEELITDHS